MTTSRRGFLKRGAVTSMACMFPMEVLTGRSLFEPDGKQASEVLFAGKPLAYWVTQLLTRHAPPELEDVLHCDALAHFGEPAVPHLIEGLSGHRRSRCWVMLQMISGSPVRLLTEAIGNRPEVRHGALAGLNWATGLPLDPAEQDAIRKVLPIIAECLHDQDPLVRCEATAFLRSYILELDPSCSIPLPAGSSGHQEPLKRLLAVKQFGKMPPEKAIPGLVASLRDPKIHIRWAAIEQLLRLDPDHPAIVPALINHLIEGRSLERPFPGLAGLIVKALPALEEALAGQESVVCTHVVLHLCCPTPQFLRRLGLCESEEEFPGMFDRDEPESRAMAISALQMFEAKMAERILPDVIGLLNEPSPHFRRWARDILVKLPSLGERALPWLCVLLGAGEPCQQVSAALVLGDLDEIAQPSVFALRRAIECPDSSVKLAAAIALAALQPSRDLAPILFSGMNHPDRDLWFGAKVALICMKHDCSGLLPQLVDGLMKPSTRRVSAILLRSMRSAAAPAMPNLISLLKTRFAGEESDRDEVLAALAAIGPLAIGPLLELLEHEEVFVRTGAIKALGMMGSPACPVLPRLIDKLKTGCPVERVVAAEALGHTGPAAASVVVPALKTVVKDRDLAVRCSAIAALAQMGKQAESAIPDLYDTAKDPSLSPMIRCRALQTLQGMGADAAPTLARVLDNANEEFRLLAAKYLEPQWTQSHNEQKPTWVCSRRERGCSGVGHRLKHLD